MAEETKVPTTSSFDDIYPQDAIPAQKKRWDKLLAQFEQKYDRKPSFVSRSPGRVNIIGEHIDYSLYQCLPMAITADVLLAVAVNDNSSSKIRIANVLDSKFPAREFDIPERGELSIDPAAHDWSNYFKAGVRGASELLAKLKSSKDDFRSVGLDILVDGSVPAGGGLSSSAAFVCASALAVMKANGVEEVDKKELCEVAIVSERAVGVNSGGMDQAASVFAQRDTGVLIDFVPSLNTRLVSFPTHPPADAPGRSLVFLIAQSYVTSNKAETGPIHYNLRVVECTLAALYLAKVFRLKAHLPQDSSPLGQSLRGFHDTYFSENEPTTSSDPSTFTSQLEKLIQLTEDYLIQDEGYTRDDIAHTLGISTSELDSRYTTAVPVRAQRFMLRQRALHVFTEALRVQRFMALLPKSPAEAAADIPAQLGALVSATQDSCREEYACSCAELDALCAIAHENGAWGSRLTGAGWGGCSVHLVPQERVKDVTEAWKSEFYAKRWPDLKGEELEEAIVVTKPGRGSLVYMVRGRGEV